MKNERLCSLTTEYEGDLAAATTPFCDYPRPQLQRDSYLCLNGWWDFEILGKYTGKIRVPFVPESRISGVEQKIAKEDVLRYTRTFTLPDGFVRERVLLHVGACDQYATVYVNGMLLGTHEDGYLPFSFDVTAALREGENTLCIEARDPLDLDLPYGKQTEARGGMWYTPCSGVWQTVWLESVYAEAVTALKITPDLCGIDLTVEGGEEEKVLTFDGVDYPFSGAQFRLDVQDPILWTPDTPHLYEFTLRTGRDCVQSYFALRTVGIAEKNGKPLLTLNGKPFYFHGLLDQGYYSDGIFLPASPRGYVEDILRAKACGYNMLRKHIKLEPQLFYYYCDKYGMLVFADMINSGKYHFVIDTALPTVGLRRGVRHRASKKRRAAFEASCRGVVDALYNHPCVVYYTVFNEGWGQFAPAYHYRLIKRLDPTRICDTTSGWFKSRHTDVESDHVYFRRLRLKKQNKRPSVLSEFGGYSHRVEGHCFNLDRNYGYRTFDDRAVFADALVALYEKEVAPLFAQGLCATVLTQLSDVEDETNGLLTYDRRVCKVDPDRMRDLAARLQEQFAAIYLS